MPSFPFQKTTSAILLLAYANLLVMPAYAQGVPLQPPPATAAGKLPPPVRTPKQVTVNRTASPAVTAAPAEITFSAAPTESELFRARVLSEPFVVVGTSRPTPEENRALADAITGYVESNGHDLELFEQYLARHAQSPWSASIHLNLGLRLFSTGWLSRAISHFESAWQSARHATEPFSRAIADRAFGELVMMHARVGRKDTLEQLFGEVGDRTFTGKATELVAGARDGLGLMQSHPELAYRCGPGALDRILARQKNDRGFNTFLFDLPSTSQGTSLADVAKWSAQAGLDMQAAFRTPGSAFLTPAVVHWNLGHFAALFSEDGLSFQIEDPTFGARMTATIDSLDEEASGYFLVPAGPLPAGWRPVPAEEAAAVWGKGSTNIVQPEATGNGDPRARPGVPGCGMPVANAHLAVVSLNLVDTPMGYTPPFGPAVYFTLTYNQREASQPSVPDYSNLGTKWIHNWLSFIDETITVVSSVNQATPSVRLPGGGSKLFETAADPGSYPVAFPKSKDASSLLSKTAAGAYLLVDPDGSQLVFGRKVGSVSPFRYFLTEVIDPTGNAVTLGYDSQDRLVSLTDALGQVTTLDYDLMADDLKITKVTDPFGRYATFGYDGSDRLNAITDVLGLSSTFTYASSSDFVDSMTTPYGTSNFAYGESGTGGRNRWLEIANPLGEKERIECRNDWSIAPVSTAGPTPSGMTTQTSYQNYRNTLYWDRKAYKDSYNPANPDHATTLAGAHIYHWLHTDDTFNGASTVLENEKYALEGARIWYNYPGQTLSYVQGTSTRPTRIGRVLDDSTTQLYQYDYNAFDKVTSAIDPLGRKTAYIYDSNLIDLLEVRQITGAGANDYEILVKSTYNGLHQPLTVTDAAGQVTNFTYNLAGQLSTVTNAKSEVTKLFYDPDGDPAGSRLGGGARDPDAIGYLVAVDGPLSGTGDETTFEYDGYGRVAIVTDSEGYAVATDYDAFDRPTLITYPDTTTHQIVYDKLDTVAVKDRRGHMTRTAYNAIRQPVTSTDPMGRVTQFGWCKCGDLRLLVDPAGNTTHWTHDVRSRVTSKQYADGSVVKYGYEANTSRLKSVIDAKGQVTSYSYFADNLPKQISYTGAVSTPTVTWTYDSVYPRVATMVDGVGTTTYAYHDIPDGPSATPDEGDGLLASVDGPWANDTIAYTYDELGRVVERTINTTANETEISYDTFGRVDEVINPLGTFTYAYVNATGRLASVAYPNSQVTNYDYWPNTAASAGNGDQRLKEIENLKPNTSNLSTFTYAYDVDGMITDWTRKYDAGSVLASAFKYDAADQLTEANVPTTASVMQQYVYRYDKAGNRTSEQIDASVRAGTANRLNQLTALSSSGPIRFEGSMNEAGTVSVAGIPAEVAGDNSFKVDVPLPAGTTSVVSVVGTDAASNVTTDVYEVPVDSGSGRTLTYDLNGNITDNGDGQVYEWDSADRLTKIIYTGGARTEFTYDGLDRRVKIVEKDSGGSITSEKRFVLDGLTIAEERDGSNVLTKRFYGQGVIVGADEFYYTRDHLGSIRELTDDTGAVDARYDYDPYGRVTKLSGTDDADFRFTGHYLHSASGLHLAPYRAYDADTGRWLSRDPIGEGDGVNLYSVVRNNTLNAVDPLGLETWGIPSSPGQAQGMFAIAKAQQATSKGEAARHAGAANGAIQVVNTGIGGVNAVYTDPSTRAIMGGVKAGLGVNNMIQGGITAGAGAAAVVTLPGIGRIAGSAAVGIGVVRMGWGFRGYISGMIDVGKGLSGEGYEPLPSIPEISPRLPSSGESNLPRSSECD